MKFKPERRMDAGVDADEARENKAPGVVVPMPMLPPELSTNRAPVYRRSPPVMVRPLAEARPPPATESPPLVNVDVAEDVFCMPPAVMVSPLDVSIPPAPSCT